MPLFELIAILLLIGFLMYVLHHWVPWIDAGFKKIIYVVVVVVVVLWLFSMFLPLTGGPWVGRH